MPALVLVLLALFFAPIVSAGATEPGLASRETVLHPTGIAEGYLGQMVPSVAFNGDEFLVAWIDYRGGGYMPDVFGTRISREGEMRDPENLAIAATSDAELEPAVTWTGSRWMVAYPAYNPHADPVTMKVAAVEPDGEIAGVPMPLFSGARQYLRPLIASSGEHSLLVVSDGGVESRLTFFSSGVKSRSVSFTAHLVSAVVPYRDGFLLLGRVAANGFRLRATKFSGTGEHGSSVTLFDRYSDGDLRAAASSGRDVLVVAGDGGSTDVVVIDSGGDVRPVTRFEKAISNVTAAWNGDEFVVAWIEPDEDFGKLVGLRVAASGSMIDFEPAVLAELDGAVSNLVSAGGEGAVLLAWHRGGPGSIGYRGTSVHGAFVTGTDFSTNAGGALLELSRSRIPQLHAAIASSSSGYFAAWQELQDMASDPFDRAEYGRLLAARLEPRGVPESDPVVLGEGLVFHGPPFVLGGAGGDVAVWSDRGKIRGARLTPAGGIVEPFPDLSFAAWERPSIAFDGSRYMIAFAAEGEISGIRLDGELRLVDTVPIPLGEGSHAPTLVRSGSEYLLLAAVKVYPCQILCAPGDPPAIRLRRLTNEGTLIRETLVAEEYGEPAVGCSADSCLVAWPRADGIAWRLVSRDLANLWEIGSFDRSGVLGSAPAAVWDGRRFRLIWSEAVGDRTTLMMAAIGPNGLAEAAPVLLATGRAQDWFEWMTPWWPVPAAASREDGSAVVIHGRMEPNDRQSVRRLFVQMLFEVTRRRPVRR